jgi:hypothetical protein
MGENAYELNLERPKIKVCSMQRLRNLIFRWKMNSTKLKI